MIIFYCISIKQRELEMIEKRDQQILLIKLIILEFASFILLRYLVIIVPNILIVEFSILLIKILMLLIRRANGPNVSYQKKADNSLFSLLKIR